MPGPDGILEEELKSDYNRTRHAKTPYCMNLRAQVHFRRLKDWLFGETTQVNHHHPAADEDLVRQVIKGKLTNPIK